MKTISIINNKGGVGKTTTTLNFGRELARLGKKVLLIDLDPQSANLTAYLKITPITTISEVIMGGATARQAIHPTQYPNLDIIPADKSLAMVCDSINNVKGSRHILSNALQTLDDYDYCIIDNAPAITIGTYNSLTASNEVIVPLNIDAYGFYGLNGITEIIQEVKEKNNPNLYFTGCVITRHINDAIGENVSSQLQSSEQYPTFDTCIRESRKIREITFSGEAIAEGSYRCSAAVDYRRLVKEYLSGTCSL